MSGGMEKMYQREEKKRKKKQKKIDDIDTRLMLGTLVLTAIKILKQDGLL